MKVAGKTKKQEAMQQLVDRDECMLFLNKEAQAAYSFIRKNDWPTWDQLASREHAALAFAFWRGITTTDKLPRSVLLAFPLKIEREATT